MPLIDWSSTFPGNRGVNRVGRYELYDAPVGVRITIEEARKAGPILAADQEWDGLGSLVPLCVWHDAKNDTICSIARIRGRRVIRDSEVGITSATQQARMAITGRAHI